MMSLLSGRVNLGAMDANIAIAPTDWNPSNTEHLSFVKVEIV